MSRKEGHKRLVQFRFKSCCFKTTSSRGYLSWVSVELFLYRMPLRQGPQLCIQLNTFLYL